MIFISLYTSTYNMITSTIINCPDVRITHMPLANPFHINDNSRSSAERLMNIAQCIKTCWLLWWHFSLDVTWTTFLLGLRHTRATWKQHENDAQSVGMNVTTNINFLRKSQSVSSITGKYISHHMYMYAIIYLTVIWVCTKLQ